MKYFLPAAMIMAVSALVSSALAEEISSTGAGRERVVIFPTGVFPDDVDNVQAAIDELGGKGANAVLVLKARNETGIATDFNFGTDPDPARRGSVFLHDDHSGAIEFRGEHTDHGQTTIIGGNIPLHMVRRDKLTVRNIHFRRAFRNAIRVQATTGLVIEDNMFVDTEGLVDDLFPITVVISVAGQTVASPDDITGDVVIRRNVIDNANALFSDGISLFFTNARTLVIDNYVSGVNVGLRYDVYRGPIVIRGNDLMGEVAGPDFFGAGIEIGCGIGDAARASIRNNYIAVEDRDTVGFAVGISVFGGDVAGWSSEVPDAQCPFRHSSIIGNEIAVANGFDAIEFYTFAASKGRVVDNIIAHNSFRGTALNGIILENFDFLGTSPEVETSGNRIINNDLGELLVDEAHVFLGESTDSNLAVVEEGDIVTDLGTNNRVIRR